MDTAIVRASALYKSYGHHAVLSDVDFSIESGSITAILGPNGAGKTTLVRILATLTRPDSGTATITGHDIVREPGEVRAAISLTGQYAALDELLTGEENLMLAARLWRLDRLTSRTRVRELLERFELTEAARRPVRTWSGGMKRKLDLAMSLMGQPRVLFLDEPTTGLDPRSRNALWETIRDLKRAGVTVVLTTQYLEEADQLADWIYLLDRGSIVAAGTSAMLKGQIGGEVARLQFPDRATALRAASVLVGSVLEPNNDGDWLRVPTDGSASDVLRILNLLTERDLPSSRVSIHRPTLDDVFLSLTSSQAPARKVA
jgi:ABC-2 type transport system ATP-binding protein